MIQGNGGPFHVDREEVIFLGNAGTAMRPLAAVVCAGQGNFVLDGTPRMRERPIKDLVEGLLQVSFFVKLFAFIALLNFLTRMFKLAQQFLYVVGC